MRGLGIGDWGKINKTIEYDEERKEEERLFETIIEELTGDFDTEELDKGENIIINMKYSNITITTSENQKNDKFNNSTTINLGECEYLIKKEYNIPYNKSLYILKIDVKQDGIRIPKIGYEVYYPLFNTNLIKLNLTVCEGIKIDLSIPINITDNLDTVNTSSGYYNDICYTFTSDNGTDISLKDRKKDFIDNNLTICEEGCNFTEYNSSIGKATCSCFANTNTSFKIGDLVIDKDKLLKQFTDFKNIANIKILKCFNMIFKKESFKNNSGNIIMICIILLFLVSFVIFFIKGYSQINKLIKVIVFLKLNPEIVKIFNKRKKHEKNERSNNEETETNKLNKKEVNKDKTKSQ